MRFCIYTTAKICKIKITKKKKDIITIVKDFALSVMEILGIQLIGFYLIVEYAKERKYREDRC